MFDVRCSMFSDEPKFKVQSSAGLPGLGFKVQGLSLLISLLGLAAFARPPDPSFIAASQPYHAGAYHQAAEQFRASPTLRPSSGTLQTLGLAEWQCGSNGPAILAW